MDYITKPVSAPIVRARVRNHLSLVRVDELVETRLAVVQRLGRAAEYKDNETGLHVIRMSHYMGEAWSETLLNAAAMHDVGKIGIPRCHPPETRQTGCRRMGHDAGACGNRREDHW